MMEKCPICGADVNRQNAPAQCDFHGRTYYFCCDDCKRQFRSDPESYVRSREQGMQDKSTIRDE